MMEEPVADLPDKVLKYEEFLNERLRPDLKKVLDAEQQVCNDMANCDQVCTFLQQLKSNDWTEAGSQLKVQTDLGCNFYVEAVIDQTETANVYLGLGVYLEMPIDQASVYLKKREQMLQQKRLVLIEKANHIKANIKLVYEGLRELQNIPETAA